MEKVVLGIDIGGTNTEIGFVTEKGEVVATAHTPTLTNTDFKHYFNALVKAIRRAEQSLKGNYKIAGAGIGAPNGNYLNGCIENAVNLGWGDKVPIIDMLKEEFDYDVCVLSNDANAAAVGEMIFGGARDFKNFIMLTLGTGLGSGIIINGQLVVGTDGNAGELGHLTVVPGGRECGCGHLGCLENYCSATGMVRTALEFMAYNKVPSVLRDFKASELTSKDIFDAAQAGDSIALDTFQYTGEILGAAINDMITFSSPEAIVLFGGPTKAGDFILNPTIESMKANKRKFMKNDVKVLISELDGAQAAVLGAAAMAWNDIQ
ncbi:ROK family protein [Saccharicrinis sp. FJH62]|uniref:ROK family protein n=1 Tax=Saccharicrinis sp. FJH62 TaxID=3344657 RepID=UPI0035D43D67